MSRPRSDFRPWRIEVIAALCTSLTSAPVYAALAIESPAAATRPQPAAARETSDPDDEVASSDASPNSDTEIIRPPRADGAFVTIIPIATMNLVRVPEYMPEGPHLGGGGLIRVGELVYPWLSVGLAVAGSMNAIGGQTSRHLSIFADFGFYPKPPIPFSIRVGAGAGGGRVTERGRDDKPGFGGAALNLAFRYEWFPGADRRRPKTAGGFSLGLELGWFGFPPTAKGKPTVHSPYFGLTIGPYGGR